LGVVHADQAFFAVEVVGGLFARQQRLADALAQGVVAVAGQWLAILLDLDQAFAAVVAVFALP